MTHFKEEQILEYSGLNSNELKCKIKLIKFIREGLPFSKNDDIDSLQETFNYERWNCIVIESFDKDYIKEKVYTLNIPYLYSQGIKGSLDWKQNSNETSLLEDKFLTVSINGKSVEIF